MPLELKSYVNIVDRADAFGELLNAVMTVLERCLFASQIAPNGTSNAQRR
jgi:hypothetical protein